MPELAEVALFARDLNLIAKRGPISKVSFFNSGDWGDVVVPLKTKMKMKEMVGYKVTFRSSGKALLLHLRGQRTPSLEIRLGMTGQFHMSRQEGKWKRHYFFKIRFDDQDIFFADPRRFGRVRYPILNEYAIGGFGSKGYWSCEDIQVPEGYMNMPRISWLLSTGDLTGVGNYMANEALGDLNLSPYLPCRGIDEAKRILQKCQDIASGSFVHGGNSFGTGYFLLDGTEGGYSRYCRFYQNPSIKRQIFRGRPVYSHFPNR